MKRRPTSVLFTVLAGLWLVACGGGGNGPQVRADPQSIAFGAPPALAAGATAMASASASSGLAVRFGSMTPAVCSVDPGSGMVAGLAAGTCTLVADQSGNADWAPAPQRTLSFPVAADPHQTVHFGAPPLLSLGDTASFAATASSGLAVQFSSLSPTVCRVDAATGLATGLAVGQCTIAADQSGDAGRMAAPQALQTVVVQLNSGPKLPGIPTGVTATLGSSLKEVVVTLAAVDGGGSAVTAYTVSSSPAAIVATAAALPVKVVCPATCAGYAFSVAATNAVGRGEASAAVDVVTPFDVVARFHEPDTQPRDTIFTGTLVLDSTTGAVVSLSGSLTESMTGSGSGVAPAYDMTQVRLDQPLQVWHDAALGGTLVASFARSTTATFTTAAGGDGWSPKSGIDNGGVYAGFPSAYAKSIQNAYVLIALPDDPFQTPTPAQIDRIAYADCTPGGMMGAVCMTATSVAGYGAVGTMSGYPVSLTLTRH
jgi:hypothetical protein